MDINNYEKIIDSLPTGHAFLKVFNKEGDTPDYQLLKINQKMREILKAEEADILYHSVEDLLIFFPKLQKEWTDFRSLGLDKMQYSSVEFYSEYYSGWFQIDILPHDEEHISLLCTEMNKTRQQLEDLKQQEILFQQLSKQIPGAVFQLQMDKAGEMSIPYFSAGSFDISKFPSLGKSMTLENVFEDIHPEDKEEFFEAIFFSKQTGKTCNAEFRMIDYENNIHWLRASSHPVYLRNEKVVWNGHITDISEEKCREMALRESDEKMRRLFSQVDGMLFQFDVNTDFSFSFSLVSEGVFDLTGLTVEEASKNAGNVFRRIHTNDLDRLSQSILYAAEHQTLWQEDFRIIHPEKGVRWVRGNAKPEKRDKLMVRFYGYLYDITKQRENEEALASREKLIAEYSSKVPGVIFQSISYKKDDFSFLTATGSISTILEEKVTSEEIVNIGMVELIYPEDRCWMLEKMNESREYLSVFNETFRILLSDGGYKWVHGSSTPEMQSDGGVLYSGYLHDVTEKKKNELALEESEKRYRKLAAEMKNMAYHDSLTGLPNRRMLFDRLEQHMLQSGRTKAKLGLVFIDLDDFKATNDRFGHETGDRLLIHVAQQLRSSVRETDTVARMAGDEFLLLFTDIEDMDLHLLMDEVIKKLKTPFPVNDHFVQIEASLGIALYPDHGKTVDELFMNADKAMYQRKRTEKNGFSVYERGMDFNK